LPSTLILFLNQELLPLKTDLRHPNSQLLVKTPSGQKFYWTTQVVSDTCSWPWSIISRHSSLVPSMCTKPCHDCFHSILISQRLAKKQQKTERRNRKARVSCCSLVKVLNVKNFLASHTSRFAIYIALLGGHQKEAYNLMARSFRVISAQIYYTAIPQLISRISHPNQDTSLIVLSILSRILTKFPAQAMWPLAWLLHSASSDRTKTGEELFRAAQASLVKRKDTKMSALLGSSKDLFKWLIDLAK
jgi:hypothetical protein